MIALADGAGGTSHGARAAQALVDAVGAAVADAIDASALIETLDRVGEGQTTAIVLAVDAEGITGSSVGDSGAWLVGDEVVDLTEGQLRKPLVGGGGIPVAFATGPIGSATVLVASDGLFRHARQADIVRIARGPDLDAAARALIALVRLPSGGLQDDVAVVLCRVMALTADRARASSTRAVR
ncbi:MAG: serine/threonine protein phosphatase [Proteobacteria bacterium]|nr:serine/threonine protein phosphatase [Pseudomonadota bacterium]